MRTEKITTGISQWAKQPIELETLEDWAANLEIYLNGPFVDFIDDEGKLRLLQIKARVDQVRGMKIEIYPDEHAPPHFHVKTGKISVSLEIADCNVLNGSISGSDLNKIKVWHRDGGREKLIEVWNSMRPTDCTVGEFRD